MNSTTGPTTNYVIEGDVHTPYCWCHWGYGGNYNERFRWMPGDPILRFPLEEK